MMIKERVSSAGRFHKPLHISTYQYVRRVREHVTGFGLEPGACGTHSMWRRQAVQILWNTGTLRAVQRLPGNTKMDDTVRYLVIEWEDVATISEAVAT